MINCSPIVPGVPIGRHPYNMSTPQNIEYYHGMRTLSQSSDDSEDFCDGPSSTDDHSANSSASNIECKPFTTFDTLRYERERLATYINWPKKWLSPHKLAEAGFYYLRTEDHCSCVFCRGIVGAWEKGDDPLEEHGRHFPTCPFIKEKPVGNVPILQGDILSSLDFEEPLEAKSNGSIEEQEPKRASDVFAAPTSVTIQQPLQNIQVYTGPVNKEYITKEARRKSFKDWPVTVQVNPEKLADAGFFYLTLSDHVRCFHCGQGLRNWLPGDDPWVEHARWYPDCHHVHISKGKDFIALVQQRKPTHSHVPISPPVKHSTGETARTPSIQPRRRVRVTEKQLDSLMELDIPKALLFMDFSVDVVRATLANYIQETGLPFQTLEACIEKVLIEMDKSSNGDEAEQMQQAKMARHNEARQAEDRPLSEGGEDVVNTTRSPTLSRESSSANLIEDEASQIREEVQPQIEDEYEVMNSSVSPPVETISRITIEETTPSNVQESLSMEVGEVSNNGIESSHNQVTPTNATAGSLLLAASQTQNPEPSTSNIQISTHIGECAEEMLAKEHMKVTRHASDTSAKSYKTTGSHCRSTSMCSTVSRDDSEEHSDDEMAGSDCECETVECLKAKNEKLRATLEAQKEARACKVCMDAEVAVVLLPCTHMVTCAACTLAVSVCPFCRADIVHAIRPNMAA